MTSLPSLPVYHPTPVLPVRETQLASLFASGRIEGCIWYTVGYYCLSLLQ